MFEMNYIFLLLSSSFREKFDLICLNV